MVKIGLEIHGYLNTREKLFCRCKVEHGAKLTTPNVNICPICVGEPGSKPMLPNKTAVLNILKIGLMLDCKINKKFVWQRKHYNWPDLPKGYQDTVSGAYSIPVGENGAFAGVKIREVHIEEDPAKWDPATGKVDYNRSGIPLIEIVTEPDFSNSEEVISWLKKLILTLSYIKAINKDLGLKADVNVSTHGERVEIKNINSLDSIKKAIEFEIKRQGKEKVVRETRAWSDEKQETIRMREKEQAEDYRFIPDPDLPSILLDEKEIKKIKTSLPESPEIKLEKMIKKFKIDKKNAEILTSNIELVEFFEKISEKIDGKFALPWVTIELLRVLNYNKTTLDRADIIPEHFISLLRLVKDGKITQLKAKEILNRFIPKSFKPDADETRITNKTEIEDFCKEAIKKNSKAVEDYKSGKQESFNFLMGEVMKLSRKRADYKLAREVMEKLMK